MSIIVKEVTTKKDLWKWVKFPNKLYKGNEFYVPFLGIDEFETFTKDKNPAYQFCETRLFLAYRDGEIVGRIAGLINHAYNQKWKKEAIRFTRFDFIDDLEVSKALFDRVVEWGKEIRLNEIMGPIGFTDIDHEGMLVEGFDKLSMSITFYNHPYYLEHMKALGLVKDIDWIEYKITVPTEIDPKIEKLTDRLKARYDLVPVTYTDRKVLYKEAFEAFKLIDTAYSKLYGTVPLTPSVIKKIIDDYIPLVNLDYICTIKDKEGNLLAFGVLIPSIAKALKACDGKMFPTGLPKLMSALKGKNDTLEMFLVAVDPGYQHQGVPALLMSTLHKNAVKNGVKYCETGPMLETNKAVHGMWRFFEKEQHKRRRCYIKKI
jgi:GNAT superfamily N-acetyltransferase